MPSYQERSQIIKALAEQEYFDALQKEQNKSVQIGAKRGDTGRHQVIHSDGGVTSNGDKIFNASIPQDGFVRGNASGNAIALEHRNVRRKALLPQLEEPQTNEVVIKILFIGVDGNMYVGGDRQTPDLIYAKPNDADILFFNIRATGTGLDDWISDIGIGRNLTNIGSSAYYQNVDYITIDNTSNTTYTSTRTFSYDGSNQTYQSEPSIYSTLSIGYGVFSSIQGAIYYVGIDAYAAFYSAFVNTKTDYVSPVVYQLLNAAQVSTGQVVTLDWYIFATKSDFNISSSNVSAITVDGNSQINEPVGSLQPLAIGMDQSPILVGENGADTNPRGGQIDRVRLYPNPIQETYSTFLSSDLVNAQGENIIVGLGSLNLINNTSYSLAGQATGSLSLDQDGTIVVDVVLLEGSPTLSQLTGQYFAIQTGITPRGNAALTCYPS